MPTFCSCIYAGLIDDSFSVWGAVLEFLFSAFVMICGIRINYKFLKNLKEERRKTPLGRKGNVIEPIMRWFCWLQIIYWSFYLLYLWINMNGIIPVEWMEGIWCNVIFHLIITGRICVAYNSLFVVLIRYIYIVHHRRANQWSFKTVGNWFQVVSILIPALISIMGIFFGTGSMYTHNPKFEKCYFSHNVTEDIQRYRPIYIWTSSHLPQAMVHTLFYVTMILKAVGFINVTEGYLYFSIYRSIKR